MKGRKINRKNKKVSTPDYRPLKHDTAYQKRVKRKKFRRRAAIDPIIGYLKTDFGLNKNYLWGDNSTQINVFVAAMGWNLKKMMKQNSKRILKNQFLGLLI